jgi:hypothetical protein
MHRKVKQDTLVISIGTICTGACLALGGKLASAKLHEVVLQAPLQQSPSLAEHLLRRWANMRWRFNNKFEWDFTLIYSIQVLLLSFIFALGGSWIYKNNGTSFMIFGQGMNFIWIFEVWNRFESFLKIEKELNLPPAPWAKTERAA